MIDISFIHRPFFYQRPICFVDTKHATLIRCASYKRCIVRNKRTISFDRQISNDCWFTVALVPLFGFFSFTSATNQHIFVFDSGQSQQRTTIWPESLKDKEKKSCQREEHPKERNHKVKCSSLTKDFIDFFVIFFFLLFGCFI